MSLTLIVIWPLREKNGSGFHHFIGIKTFDGKELAAAAG
jgi:hypothetical protein